MEILVKSYRGDIVDLFTTGSVAVVDKKGNLVCSAGDPYSVSYARSSAKLMQAMVPVATGAAEAYGLNDQEVSQICASHSGEKIHIDTVRSILEKIGLDESYLQCGAHYPFKSDVAEEMKKNGEPALSIHNNCSGKHSGMLATVKHLGEDLETYYQTEHPHQKRIVNLIGEMCDYDPEKIVIGLDGCGVPVHALPLERFAYGMARMACPEDLTEVNQKASKRIIDSVMKYPLNASGSDRIDYKIMSKYLGNVVVKSGANGYFTGAIIDKGLGFAIKADDGNSTMRNAILIEVLHQLGVISAEDLEFFKEEHEPSIYNHKKEFVGVSKTCFKLK